MKRIVVRENAYVGPWIAEHGGGEYREGTQCIGLESEGELIAGVMYDSWNGSSLCIHVAASGARWLNREYLHVCFDYPFRQLGAKVLIGLVAESNLKARRFDEHLGFKLHASIPEGHPDGSLLIYTMRKEDCRWIGESNGQQVKSAACA